MTSAKHNWVLSDFPPQCLVPANTNVIGDFLLLAEDSKFTISFKEFLPFCPDIGWFPDIFITGIFQPPASNVGTLPTLQIGFVEFKAPLPLAGRVNDLATFATQEIASIAKKETIHDLDQWSKQVLFSYLAPILFRGSTISPKQSPPALSTVLKQFIPVWGNDLPRALTGFYSSLP